MKKLLKAEWYRFCISPASWILPAAYLLMVLLNTFLQGFLYGNAAWLGELYQNAGMIAEMAIQLLRMTTGGSVQTFEDLIHVNVGCMNLLITVIFICVFCISRKSSGYVKNLMPEHGRRRLFFADLIFTAGFVTVLDIIYLLVMLLWRFLFFSALPITGVLSFIGYILLLWLLTVACSFFTFSIIETFRSHVPGMIIALVYTAGVNQFIYKALNLILLIVSGKRIRVEYVLPLGMMTALDVQTPVSYIFAAGVILIYGGLSVFFLYRVSKKRDM